MRKAMNAGGILAMVLALAAPALASDKPDRCSVEAVAGRWIFATDVGHYPPGGGDITALGTLNVDKEGNVNGVFDVTLEPETFGAGCPYVGKVTMGRNCIGTMRFETCSGSTRTDTIALVGRSEIWGMSQDPTNLWTYQARRIWRY